MRHWRRRVPCCWRWGGGRNSNLWILRGPTHSDSSFPICYPGLILFQKCSPHCLSHVSLCARRTAFHVDTSGMEPESCLGHPVAVAGPVAFLRRLTENLGQSLYRCCIKYGNQGMRKELRSLSWRSDKHLSPYCVEGVENTSDRQCVPEAGDGGTL